MWIFWRVTSTTYLHLKSPSFSCQAGCRKCLRMTYRTQTHAQAVVEGNTSATTWDKLGLFSCSKRVYHLPNMCTECSVHQVQQGVICSGQRKHSTSHTCATLFSRARGLNEELSSVLRFFCFAHSKEHSLLCGCTRKLRILISRYETRTMHAHLLNVVAHTFTWQLTIQKVAASNNYWIKQLFCLLASQKWNK